MTPMARDRDAPGTARRSLTCRAPVDVLPGDTLQDKIDKFAAFERLLDILDRFLKDFADVQSRLELSTPALCESLDTVTETGLLEGLDALLAQTKAQFASWAERLQHGRKQLEGVQDRIEEARCQALGVGATLRARAEVWPTKQAAEKEVEVLNSRFGKTYSIEEKKGRLQAKHTANETWRKLSSEAEKCLDECLGQQLTTLTGVLAPCCRCLSVVLVGGQSSSDELSKLSLSLNHVASGLGLPPQDKGGILQKVLHTASRRPTAPPVSSQPCASTTKSTGSISCTDHLHSFAVGERVEVWSDSEQKWLPGVVDKIFDEAGEDNGYAVPAGVIRVTHTIGVKYVRSEQLALRVRRLSESAPPGEG